MKRVQLYELIESFCGFAMVARKYRVMLDDVKRIEDKLEYLSKEDKRSDGENRD